MGERIGIDRVVPLNDQGKLVDDGEINLDFGQGLTVGNVTLGRNVPEVICNALISIDSQAQQRTGPSTGVFKRINCICLKLCPELG